MPEEPGAGPPDPGDLPSRHARTQGFTFGLPRSFTVASDGSRVAFLRSAGGEDPVNALWVLDVAEPRERLVFDPRERADARGEESLPEAERARRERARESGAGIVVFDGDPDLRTAVFALGGRLHVANLLEGGAREVATGGPVFDPRIAPDGGSAAYVSDGALRWTDLGEADRELVSSPDPEVSWGLAEFVASEEMGRLRGFWWSPLGGRIAAARVDNGPVAVWHVADPADPAAAPRAMRYPAAGTANADVSLWLLTLDGGRLEVPWSREAFPYLARIDWRRGSPLTLLVQSRDQRRTLVLTVNETTGVTTVVHEEEDPAWIELVVGAPAWTADGRLVRTADLEDTRRLVVGDEPVSPPGLQVRQVLHVGEGVLFAASEEPMETHVWRWAPDGSLEQLTERPGVHGAAAGGDATVVLSATLEDELPVAEVRRGGHGVATIASNAEPPPLEPRITFLTAGERELRTALVVPHGWDEDRRLPVLVDPYGGPHLQRVVRARGGFLVPQWFAEQGFAVLVADGRGTPGRGVAWEKAIHLDVAETVLQDQVDALAAAAEEHPALDLDRVAIRGWSFGGYLSALAVLRRPDVFHAAIVGAPVTDWRLYDTHYTERYLGHPDEGSEIYARNSVVNDAVGLSRPMLILHGTSDDNVVLAHSLRLSRALFEHGRPHSLLLLPNVTHMTRATAVAENLLRLQLDFLRSALGLPSPTG